MAALLQVLLYAHEALCKCLISRISQSRYITPLSDAFSAYHQTQFSPAKANKICIESKDEFQLMKFLGFYLNHVEDCFNTKL